MDTPITPRFFLDATSAGRVFLVAENDRQAWAEYVAGPQCVEPAFAREVSLPLLTFTDPRLED